MHTGGALADVNNPLYHRPRFAQVSPVLMQLRTAIEQRAQAQYGDDDSADTEHDASDDANNDEANSDNADTVTESHSGQDEEHHETDSNDQPTEQQNFNNDLAASGGAAGSNDRAPPLPTITSVSDDPAFIPVGLAGMLIC